jgi:hypothetical protein
VKVRTEWRVTWREHDFQGGFWKMPPEIFTDEAEARRFYRRQKAKEGEHYDGATRDVKLEQTVVVAVQK